MFWLLQLVILVLTSFIRFSYPSNETYVSYAIFTPKNDKVASRNCLQNLEIFINRAIVNFSNITYAFIIIGNDTVIPNFLEVQTNNYSNVKIFRDHNRVADLCSHSYIYNKRYKENNQVNYLYKYYLFLNCGARGPYYGFENSDRTPNRIWLDYFTSKLNNITKLVGPTINCELGVPHVQTYAVAMDAIGMKFALDAWNCKSKKKEEIIKSSELGLSQRLIKNNYNIASTAMYHDWDFRNPKTHSCGRNNQTISKPSGIILLLYILYFSKFIIFYL